MRELSAGDRLDRYRLLELIARSGPATIFKAVDEESGATVAVKVPTVQGEGEAELHERLRREEQVGRRLDHPNVVKVLPTGAKTQAYVVMEYVRGRTLREELRECGVMAADRAVRIARQLCEALVHLHAHGVVHRNLRPENLILREDGHVTVLGLGLALDQSARRLTWTGLSSVIGAAEYLAPEQILGKRGDARSDLYAAGVILYELLCGEVPFPRRGADSLGLAKLLEVVRPPSRIDARVDRGLEAIVLRCLQSSPEDRYQTAAELLRDLQDPGGAHPRAAAPARQKPIVLSLAVAAVLGGLAVLMWLS